jgi:hemolysin III
MERMTLGKMQNPIRGFLHGGAALLSLVGLIALLVESSGSPPAIRSSLVFCGSLVAMYCISALYHSLPWGETWKGRMQRLDHTMIFLVVAGTFTPIAIASLSGTALRVALWSVWILAVIGILLKTLLPRTATWLSLTIQLSMGWSALIWMPSIYRELGTAAIVLIAIGGLFYTIGVVIFTRKRPVLLARSFSYHELFHVMVIIASLFHYLAVYLYAIPAIVR